MKRIPLFEDKMLLAGLLLTFVSALIFLIPEYLDYKLPGEMGFGLFVMNYLAALGYLIAIGVNSYGKRWYTFSQKPLKHLVLFFALALISCFSLNREIRIFEPSELYLSVYVNLLFWGLIGFSIKEYLPKLFSYFIYFMLGASALLTLYFSIYLSFLMPFALIGFFIFGFSLHVFVPLLILIAVIKIGRKAYRNETKGYFRSYLAGLVLPFVFLIGFVITWSYKTEKIASVYNKTFADYNSDFPNWIRLSQQLDADWITQTVLKHEVTYNTNFFDFDAVFRSGKTGHDPLLAVATQFSRDIDLSTDERIRVLNTVFDARNLTERRLWSGSDLTTSSIISLSRIYPEYRIGYTEKILTIKNSSQYDWNQQEAIYIFNLPEGSAVSSVSLWIDGVEEEGILTSKKKADSAYTAIVGVERRDPCLIHWQEGNRVSVRVFPCPPKEPRKFKIGVTSPLKLADDKLVLEDIEFKGPDASEASVLSQIEFEGEPSGLELPSGFEKEGSKYVYEGEKTAAKISFSAVPLKPAVFCFDSVSCKVDSYTPAYGKFEPGNIYLDMNRNWSRDEFEAVISFYPEKNIYVFLDELVRVKEENKDELFKEVSELNFSIFPFYLVTDPSNSLVISKPVKNSPNLEDIKTSFYVKKLNDWLKLKKEVRLFNLGSECSPFLHSLKEFRYLVYDQGNLQQLGKLARNKQFLVSQENENTVVIDAAGLKLITEPASGEQVTAPDHLLRLYAYNDILKKIGKDYCDKDFIREDLVKQAVFANVVTPVSSLVVLESQKDYDRFNIKKGENSLGNASMKNSGAVPEPHEYILIAILLLSALLFWLQSRYKFIRL